MLALAIGLILASTSPKAFTPPVMQEPTAPPAAWFVEDPRRRRWCEFASRKAAEGFSKTLGDFAPADTPGAAWIRTEGGKLASVTVQVQSDDAFTEDRYFFDAAGRVSELRRTGAYAGNKPATYVLKPGPSGKLAPTPDTRALLHRVEALKYETYFVEWPAYRRLSELPFASLLDQQGGKTVVKSGCTSAGTKKNRAH